MTELLDMLHSHNTRTVLLGVGLLGIAASVIGTLAVLRRRALLGDALAHAALPGVCLAWFAVGDRSFVLFLVGALVSSLAGVAAIALIRAHTRIKEDAAVGIVLASFFGLGIVLSRIIQNAPSGNRAGLDGFILGKAAAMTTQDLYVISAAALFMLIVLALLYKELKLLCFDREFAAVQGWPVVTLDLVLMGLVALCTIVGLPAVGVVLMAALLIIPAVAASFWTSRLLPMLIIAGVFGLVSSVGGAALSALEPGSVSWLARGLPTGPLIALSAATLFLVSMVCAPRKGLVARWIRVRRVEAPEGRS